MLSRPFALGLCGIVAAGGLALACAQSVDDPLVQDDVGVANDSKDAGPSPTHDKGPTPTTTPMPSRDSGAPSIPKDADSPQETGTPDDTGAPAQDSAVDPADTGGNTNSVACPTSGLAGIKYAAEFLSAVNPCPCAATECCYQQLLCVAK